MHFLRGVSGIRNDTLIFNLFGFYKEEAVKCFNVMITEIEQKLIKEKKKRAAISSNNASSSNNNDNNTDWVTYFLCFRNNEIIVYVHK